MEWPDHGGQPKKILELKGINKDDLYVDFSANINPLGPPMALKESFIEAFNQFEKYPDPNYEEATKLVATHEGVRQEQTLLTNGGSEAIFLVAQQFTGEKALIIEPTFSEYERACHVFQLSVTHLSLQQEDHFSFPLEKVISKMEEVDVVFLCRPNNPTGTVVDIEDIKAVLEKGIECQTTIVIDEAFIHFLPSHITDLAFLIDHYANLVLLRSLTKIFSIPSLRLGYVVAREEMIFQLKRSQIPWSVNGIVTSILPCLVTQHEFIDETKAWLQGQLKLLTTELSRLGFYYSPTLVNFYLLRDLDRQADTEQLFLYLLENNIIPRHTHTFKGLDGNYLRLAVRTEAENNFFLQTLRRWRDRQC
ncbi:pyridoxal phosphate-dependent aminotransferase [Metabacillus elymi]|uniref:Pyridoxal phosphate-dependent class II aminotransferase n=1 Tax=Metabacillus elymi TaxID=2745198 RepID=A0ABX6S978_9BACI|nr:threonine-phosphate decarboxylase [Metabacillus sp. KUDC1714]QNF30307.1 pyridoxal phosphate-dependent class II aminotransferase [Metabacillus sp. KUDC1714]